MAYYAGLGVVAAQRLQEFCQRCLLLWSAGVGFPPLGVNAALVAYSDGTVVVTRGMSTANVLGQDGEEVAVSANIPVVTGLSEALYARILQRFYGEVAIAARC